MPRRRIFREGRVHVCARMCGTCIFLPGNRMSLAAGRVEGMVREAHAEGTAIVCHETLAGGGQAVCRGFFDKHPTSVLQVAFRLGYVREVNPGEEGRSSPAHSRHRSRVASRGNQG